MESLRKPEPDVDRECAEWYSFRTRNWNRKGRKPLRYVAIRLRKPAGEDYLLDGSSVLHFAVLSNIWTGSR